MFGGMFSMSFLIQLLLLVVAVGVSYYYMTSYIDESISMVDQRLNDVTNVMHLVAMQMKTLKQEQGQFGMSGGADSSCIITKQPFTDIAAIDENDDENVAEVKNVIVSQSAILDGDNDIEDESVEGDGDEDEDIESDEESDEESEGDNESEMDEECEGDDDDDDDSRIQVSDGGDLCDDIGDVEDFPPEDECVKVIHIDFDNSAGMGVNMGGSCVVPTIICLDETEQDLNVLGDVDDAADADVKVEELDEVEEVKQDEIHVVDLDESDEVVGVVDVVDVDVVSEIEQPAIEGLDESSSHPQYLSHTDAMKLSAKQLRVYIETNFGMKDINKKATKAELLHIYESIAKC